MDVDEVASAMQILLEGGADFNKYPGNLSGCELQ